MVLADRGVVCIDEFDKMSDQDRVAIHEVWGTDYLQLYFAVVVHWCRCRRASVSTSNPSNLHLCTPTIVFFTCGLWFPPTPKQILLNTMCMKQCWPLALSHLLIA